ncbi:hypothetical protein DL96DRAFT_1684585 [Flagelloscypha sp. PMI_526]|nr:hypothetical protein DL96DRAFT_1684585 [Flagelloscypha sp. PMI_526]
MLTLTDSQSPTSSAMRLPPEILDHVVSFIENGNGLKAMCLASKIWVFPAQAKLFSHLDLTRVSPDSIHSQSRISLLHIFQHTRSLVVDVNDTELSVILDALAQKAKLGELTLISPGYSRCWNTSLLRPLLETVLPLLSALTLDAVTLPLFLLTSCTFLRCLRAYEAVLYIEGDEAFDALFDKSEDPVKELAITPRTLESKSMAFLSTLAFESAGIDRQRLSPLARFAHEGKFPALKCLDLTRNNAQWVPQRDIVDLARPLMNQLVCLDIGYWPKYVNEEDHSRDLDLFEIHRYPHLLFFSIRLQGQSEDAWYDLSIDIEYLYNQLLSHTERLLDNIAKLTSIHPLTILRIHLAGTEYENINTDDFVDPFENTDLPSVEPMWKLLDSALTQNQHLESLEKLVIPIHPKFQATRELLKHDLVGLHAAGKLSFDVISMEEYFLSLE